ncbi:MAG TPA: hypothetical protein PKV13_00240 [Propionicimonas sp.]|nr:hypothetical protein [Propionicimonas sp.]HRA05032.1 hypothetical protein [Propionicimonas sp.]
MSALLIDDLVPLAPSAQPNGWRHVRGREFVPQLALVPEPPAAATPVRVPAANPRAAQWQLTDRGIKVVVSFFLAIFATAVLVLATGFFAVSDAPFAPAAESAAVLAQG